MWHLNFSCCFIWVWNLIPQIKGRTKGESIRDLGIVESIWAKEGESTRRLEKWHNEEIHSLHLLLSVIWVIRWRRIVVSRAYDMHGVEERCIQDFGGETCFEDPVIDWKILKWLLKT